MRRNPYLLGALLLLTAGAAPSDEAPEVPFSGYFGFCVSKDGKRLAVDCWDVWDIPSRKRLFSGKTRGGHGMSFSPDGKFLAVVGNYSEFYVYDASDGKEYWNLTLTGHGDTVLHHVEFTPDSKFMVSSSANGLLRVWDVKNKKAEALFCFPTPIKYDQGRQDEYLRAWRALAGKRPPEDVKTFVVFKETVENFWDFTLNPDGKTVAVPRRLNGEVLLLELATGKILATFHTKQEAACSVRFSSDGKLLAIGGGDGEPDRNTCTIEVWDVAAKRLLRTLPGHRQTVLHLAFSPDGKLLASGGLNDGVRVWELATGKQLYRLHEKTKWRGEVVRNLGVAFLPDGKALLTLPWGEAEPVHFWEPRTGKRIEMVAPEGKK